MEYQPLVVITPNNEMVQFTDELKAYQYAKANNGEVYRRNHYYENVMKMVKMLNKEIRFLMLCLEKCIGE